MSSLYIRRQIDPEIPRTWGLDRPSDFDLDAVTQRLTRGTTIYNKRKNEMLNFQKKRNILNARRVWSDQSELLITPTIVAQPVAAVIEPTETTEPKSIDDQITDRQTVDEQNTEGEAVTDGTEKADDVEETEQKESPPSQQESAIKQLTPEEEAIEQEMLYQQIEYQRKQRRLQLEREKARALRRLCAPTKSSRARSAVEDRRAALQRPETKLRPYSSASTKPMSKPLIKTTTETDEREMQMQLDFHRRPTRSYSAKLQGFRAYVKRPKEKKQYDPANEKLVQQDDSSCDESVASEDSLLNQIPSEYPPLYGPRLEGHVHRVSSATHSSAHRAHPFQEAVLCARHRKCNYAVPMATALYVQDPSLPLIAGLPRTKRTTQIS